MSHKMRYALTTDGLCCGYDTIYFDSLEDLMFDGWYQSGDVVRQAKEDDCEHWFDKMRWEFHTIELYEVAEYLDDWGVDTLDSDKFIVYTDGTLFPEPMLKILKRKEPSKCCGY